MIHLTDGAGFPVALHVTFTLSPRSLATFFSMPMIFGGAKSVSDKLTLQRSSVNTMVKVTGIVKRATGNEYASLKLESPKEIREQGTMA